MRTVRSTHMRDERKSHMICISHVRPATNTCTQPCSSKLRGGAVQAHPTLPGCFFYAVSSGMVAVYDVSGVVPAELTGHHAHWCYLESVFATRRAKQTCLGCHVPRMMPTTCAKSITCLPLQGFLTTHWQPGSRPYRPFLHIFPPAPGRPHAPDAAAGPRRRDFCVRAVGERQARMCWQTARTQTRVLLPASRAPMC